MQELFNFVVVRPVDKKVSDQVGKIDIQDDNTNLRRLVTDARSEFKKLKFKIRLKETNDKLRPDFKWSIGGFEGDKKLDSNRTRNKEARSKQSEYLDQLDLNELEQIISSAEWSADKKILDSIILVGKLKDSTARQTLAEASALRQSMHALELLAKKSIDKDVLSFQKALNAPLKISEKRLPRLNLRPDNRLSNQNQALKKKLNQSLKQKTDQYQNFAKLVSKFTNLNQKDFAPATNKFTYQNLASKYSHNLNTNLTHNNLDLVRGTRKINTNVTAYQQVNTAHIKSSPKGDFSKSLNLTKNAHRKFDVQDLKTLKNFDLSLTDDVTQIVSTLKTHKKQLASELDAEIPAEYKTKSFTMLNAAILPVGSSTMGLDSLLAENIRDILGYKPLGDLFLPLFPSAPVTAGPSLLQPAGVAQLLVVKQQILRYEKFEVAHVENIMAGEERAREHKRRSVYETNILTDIETETFEEKDLQSTEKFEMSTETKEVAKEEMKAKGALSVTAKYGPWLEVTASGEVAYTDANERTTEAAMNFSREVTQKAISRIKEKVRKRKEVKTIDETEEFNSHKFSNTDSEHIVGIYQWLNKVYQAQVFDRGLRTMYDFIVPEPAAFYIKAFQEQSKGSLMDIIKPDALYFEAKNLTEDNYLYYAAKYGAAEVTPPPDEFVTVAVTLNMPYRENWRDVSDVKSDEIRIPKNYQAYKAFTNLLAPGNEDTQLACNVGTHFKMIGNTADYWEVDMISEIGTIPVTLTAIAAAAPSASTEILCKRTARAYEEWQIQTFDQIRIAYENKLSEYNKAIQAVTISSQSQIKGNNPEANKKLIASELKRAAISIIANERMNLDLINEDVDGVPYVDLNSRRQKESLIRFLEQAFEWENMNFLFYPYFWGRKEPDMWAKKILFDDHDANFTDFIKAGAARMQLPVRPGFTEMVDHYCKTGEVWSGGELPAISDDTYLDFVTERVAQLGYQEETPVGEPWEVVVPTNLVSLNKAGLELPSWSQAEDGSWIEG